MIKYVAIKVKNKIYTGTRHHKIIDAVMNDNPDISIITQEMQGFVTDDGTFVDRYTAAEIAYKCGQLKQPKKILYSEDIL